MSVKTLIAIVSCLALLGGTAQAHHAQIDTPSARATQTATPDFVLRARLQHERLALTIPQADMAHEWIGGAW